MPNGLTDIATFNVSNTTNASVSQNTEVNGVVFAAGASAFTITVGPTFTFTFSGAGVINNSGLTQNFITTANGGQPGAILFHNNASAGNSTIFTNSAATGGGFFPSGGQTRFQDNATAAGGTFINNGGYFFGGATGFSNTSTAGSATFINNGFSGAGNQAGGTTSFSGSSSASNGTFTNNGAEGPGGVSFLETSTAGDCTIISNAGSGQFANGGFVRFKDDSTGGTARVELFGNGSLDLSTHNPPGVTIDSIEGSGIAYVGRNTLTVGSNNTSRSFSGFIYDAVPPGGETNGVFSKIGSGILTFEGHAGNDYIGDRMTLRVANNSTINLNYIGAPDVVRSLIVGGIGQLPGVYGSPTSGAPHTLTQFTGSGTVLSRMLVVSRKSHGSSGARDVTLSIRGDLGIESRNGGANGNYQTVFTFITPVTFSNASFGGNGMVSSATGNGTTVVTVNLTAVGNAQAASVILFDVDDGTTVETISIPIGFLIGDTNADGFVNSGDALQTRGRSGQTTDATNFRSDVNGDGFVNSGDTTAVRARSGTSLP